MHNKLDLVLASASPRRAELLGNMGCNFTTQSADIDESQMVGEGVDDYVSRMAREKAHCIATARAGQRVAILAADTIVVQGQSVFTKPQNQQHAFQIWSQLADSQHSVITAVCLTVLDTQVSTPIIRLVRSDVEFGAIDDGQMQRYWKTGEPQDKAGAYAIQGYASAWVKLIHGSYSNIVGLPLRETNEILKTVGLHWL